MFLFFICVVRGVSLLNKFFKNFTIYLLIIVLAFVVINYLKPTTSPVQKLDYLVFFQMVEKKEVKNVTISMQDSTVSIAGKLINGKDFTTESTREEIDQLSKALKEKGILYKYNPPQRQPWWSTWFIQLLPIVLLGGLVFFMLQQTQGGGNRVMSFGKSKARLNTDEKKRVSFDDVAGADEVKEELEEVVEFLKQPKKFHEVGAKIPKGILLVGSPGTGKTLLARAVSGEAGVPFFSISGSDFVEMFVGVGASRVRDLFEQAKKNSPCIVFIDEIDAVGRQRGAGLGGGHDEREQTLNQLLVEMDGYSPNEGIIIIAATNRPDILDPALLRPGRFDRQIVVDVPDVKGREEILKVHVKGKPLGKEVDLSVLARRTPGFTGADLANLVNEGALLTARHNKKIIGMKELEDSIERVIAGPERKSKVISEKEKKLVSYHEAGHALVGTMLPTTDPLHKVSIIPRGRAGGYTLHLPTEDRNYATKSYLLDRIIMLLGGRVAEELVLKDISTGAQSDLERATEIARKMIMEYGMSEVIGPMTLGHRNDTPFLGREITHDRNYSEEVASAIDKEVRSIIDNSHIKATKIINENMDKLDLIAKTLMEQETLEANEFEQLIKEGKLTKKELKPEEQEPTDQQEQLAPNSTEANNDLEQNKEI